MGVKKLLQEGIEKENKKISKAKKETETKQKSERTPKPKSEPASEKTKAVEDKVVSANEEQKNTGGRPTNEERGIKSRKQYTLTLKEDTYQMILNKARTEEISFAKFMERAALEYIKNHK